MQNITQDNIKEMDNGIHRMPLDKFVEREANNYGGTHIIEDLFDSFKRIDRDLSKYVIDVKVHMLMPGQYPCIPNLHYDMVPRDEKTGKQDFSRLPEKLEDMYLWVSNAPLTEFFDANGRSHFIEPRTWTAFNQRMLHRGTVSTKHIWRLFMRVCPISILEPNPPEKWYRRHTQFNLDAENLRW